MKEIVLGFGGLDEMNEWVIIATEVLLAKEEVGQTLLAVLVRAWSRKCR